MTLTWDWLISEAGAGWAAFVLTLVTIVITWLVRRTSRQHLVCRATGTTDLLRIAPGVRERIEVHFDRNPVAALAQLELDIQNRGTEPIRGAELTFRFAEGTRILDVSIEQVPETLERDTCHPRAVSAFSRFPI